MTVLSLFAVILVAVSGSTPREKLESFYAAYSRDIHQRMNNEPVEPLNFRLLLEIRSDDLISALQGWENDHDDPVVVPHFILGMKAMAQTLALTEVLQEEWPQIVEGMTSSRPGDEWLGSLIDGASAKIKKFLRLQYSFVPTHIHVNAVLESLPDTPNTASFRAWVKALVYGPNSPAVGDDSTTPEAASLARSVWTVWDAYKARQAQLQSEREAELRRQQEREEYVERFMQILRRGREYQPSYDRPNVRYG